jgi:hypothetical protein
MYLATNPGPSHNSKKIQTKTHLHSGRLTPASSISLEFELATALLEMAVDTDSVSRLEECFWSINDWPCAALGLRGEAGTWGTRFLVPIKDRIMMPFFFFCSESTTLRSSSCVYMYSFSAQHFQVAEVDANL